MIGRTEALLDFIVLLRIKLTNKDLWSAAALDGLARRGDGLRIDESGWDFMLRHVARVTAELQQTPGFKVLTAALPRKRPAPVTAAELAAARRVSRPRPLAARTQRKARARAPCSFSWTEAGTKYVYDKLAKMQAHLLEKRCSVTATEVCLAANERYKNRSHPWPGIGVLKAKIQGVERALKSTNPGTAFRFLQDAQVGQERYQFGPESDSAATSEISDKDSKDSAAPSLRAPLAASGSASENDSDSSYEGVGGE
jgi:hypothetical protein